MLGEGKSNRLTHFVKEQGRIAPLVSIAADVQQSSTHCEFSLDGRFVVWGNADGSIAVCNLVEMQHRLAEIDLGW